MRMGKRGLTNRQIVISRETQRKTETQKQRKLIWEGVSACTVLTY